MSKILTKEMQQHKLQLLCYIESFVLFQTSDWHLRVGFRSGTAQNQVKNKHVQEG